LAKKKSKKPSASSDSAQPDIPLFIDRCAWSKRLGEALKAAGIPYIGHHERFSPACPDHEWLTAAGKENWIIVTRDQNIRRKANELKAFRDAGLVVFALASGNASAADTAELVVSLYSAFLKLALSTKRPAMFSVSLGKTITLVR
jgi:predicted nuclease of predicted toxin-antitoxin system